MGIFVYQGDEEGCGLASLKMLLLDLTKKKGYRYLTSEKEEDLSLEDIRQMAFKEGVDIQWKRCCIFLKYQNFGRGWPMRRKDYFTADHYITTLDGTDGLKLGIFWPFYFSTEKHVSHGNH